MEDETDKLKQAKMFIDNLANGIDPVLKTDVNADTLNNEQVLACFRYISDVLSFDIQAGSRKSKRGKKAVYITEKQIAMLQITESRKVSEIAEEINRVIAENETRKFQPAWINDWLEANGYLCKSDIGGRIATEKGKELGIVSRKIIPDGTKKEFYMNYYNSDAQHFIIQHLKDILSLRYNGEEVIDVDYQNVEYPYHVSIIDFIRQNSDKCFIIATGFCDVYKNTGGYQVALVYKGRNKKLTKYDINAHSSNECMLYGIIDAVSAISKPTDIMILVPTSLGFNTPNSKNYSLCSEIIRSLSDKGCNISISVCKGRGEELGEFMESL